MKTLKTEIENAIAILKKGELILYPTDTVWDIRCDAIDPNAIELTHNKVSIVPLSFFIHTLL